MLAATWFGTGLSPFASGTVGTIAAIPFYLLLSRLTSPLYIIVTALFTLFACRISGTAESIFGEKDSGKIVIDEVAGYLVAMTAIPFSWKSVAAGFLLFRFFDIAKIQPCRFFDCHVKNGYGVVLDDVVAGLYSCIILHFLLRYI